MCGEYSGGGSGGKPWKARMQQQKVPLGAVAQVAIGAIAVGLSPILVRFCTVEPAVSAFWRAALAVPFLFLWMRAEGGGRSFDWRALWPCWLAGLFFAGDLYFWHESIMATTLANASFITNASPVVLVTLGAWLLLGERVGKQFLLALVLAVAGIVLMMGSSVQLDPAYLRGDVYALLTATFFSAYVLALRLGGAGSSIGGGTRAFHATFFTALGLAPLLLLAQGPLWPANWIDALPMIALALVCQAFGQGMIVTGLRHVPAGYTAMLILIEPLTTIAVGWTFMHEPWIWLQALGGMLCLMAVFMGREQR